MPPKPKFTREEVVEAALDIVSKSGIDALTARNLAERLGCSARPIFTLFKNMDEVASEVTDAAMDRYESYVVKSVKYTPIFKKFGMQMVLFANEEPKLFQFLFMRENTGVKNFEDLFGKLGDTARLCIDVIKKDYGLGDGDARELFRQLWIYTYGISSLCATGMCDFSEEQLIEMLGIEFLAMITLIKSGKTHTPTPVPKPTEKA